MEMTLEQKRALALAQARVRAEQDTPAGPDLADRYAGEDVNKMGMPMQVLGGAKTAWDRAAMGLKGVFTDLTPEDKALLEQGRAFESKAGAPATIGSIGADVAMSAGPGGLVTKAASKAPLLARTLAELGYGAGYGALTSPEDRGAGAFGGAAGTAVGMGANRLIGGAIKPFVSRDAQALADQGIQPTIGQAVGGFVNTAEQKLKSLPLVGDVIRNARGRAVDEFNEKAIQVSNPASKGIGDQALTATREALGNKYDAILDTVPSLKVDQSDVLRAAKAIAGDPSFMLKNQDKKAFLDLVRTNVLERTPDLNGQVAKQIESDLKKAAVRASSQGEKDAIAAFTDAWKASLKQSVEAVNPGAGAALRENDAAWRAFIPVERAGSYRGNQNVASNETAGKFTPNSLRRSMEVSDQSQFNNVTRALRGGDTPFERLNTLTRQGERVLGDSVPDSGTATRLMWGAGAIGAGNAAGMNPADMGMGALAALPLYSRAGSKFAMQGITPIYEAAVKQLTLRGVPTQTIDEALRKYGPQGVISLARGVGVNNQ